MSKFDLWFPKPYQPDDSDPETAFGGTTAYVCVVGPFDDGQGRHGLVKSKGRILLLNEACNAEECCRQIERLIKDLQKLKTKAEREFKKRDSN
jgi:hypothetical protein